MLFRGAFGLILFGVWLFCVIDVITTPPQRCRNLPKWAWLLIVLLLVEVGAIVWLVAGRVWEPKQPVTTGARRPARRATLAPDDDEEYLAGLRARVEEQRRRAREARPGDEQDPGSVG